MVALTVSLGADEVESIVKNDAYKKCVACHGVHGGKHALGKSKIIKDLNSSEIVTALDGYKNNTYGGPLKMIMKGQVSKLSDDEISSVADYFGKK